MLVFFSGSIGDSLITVPFLRKFRERSSSEPVYLLHDEMQPGCRVNLETDILAKYVQRLVEARSWDDGQQKNYEL